MRLLRTRTFTISAVLAVATAATAAPTLRQQVDLRGDFVLLGNTLGHECAAGTPAPLVGTVGGCGTNTADSAPDVFWRADAPANGQAQANNAITIAQARSTSVLALPAGATVEYARLYWAGTRTAGADNTVTLDRVGGFTQALTAQACLTNANASYQCTVDVTALVQTNGAGAYRLSGMEVNELVNVNSNNNFAGWFMVVFYEDFTQPPRNLALFDGLDVVASGSPQNATLSGFLVPNAGFDAKLGVVAMEGDNTLVGDALRFGTGVLGPANDLSNALNPANNFFNSTRSTLGVGTSLAGDLPRLTGTAQSMSGIDLDVVDITGRVTAGQTSANIQALSTGDVYYLSAFITSISTFKPDFTGSEKTVLDVNGGEVLAGDELEYTINVVNNGNDTAVGLVIADALPLGVTYKPGSIEIISGANAGVKTDAAGDDQAEYNAVSNTVTVRLGAGANATQGGTLAIGASTAVKFRVFINASVSGNIENQASISAAGQQGAPMENWPTDGNGAASGSPPTVIVVNQCSTNAQCAAPTPFCDTTVSPKVCVACLNSTHCSGTTPVCSPTTKTCGPCTSNANCAGTTPACQPSGACGQCSASNSTQCTGGTPVCNTSAGVCVQCVTNANCPGTAPVCNTTTNTCGACTSDAQCGGSTPACLPSGSCGQCSATNNTACTGATPHCNVATSTCVACLNNAQCPATNPECTSTNTCGPCTSDAACGGTTPACQPSGLCGECSATNTSQCGNQQACDVATGTCALDSDNDGLPDAIEIQFGTDPFDADSDDDGVLDGDEPDWNLDTDGDGLINALDPDSDNDGLFDGTELGKDCSNPATNAGAKACRPDADQGATTTDPLNADTDGGGVSDGSEDFNLNGQVDAGETDPTAGSGGDDSGVVDTDGDGLSDGLETFLGSSPTDADTDDDGLLDGDEPNPSHDTDGDGLINLLDVDSDNDALFDGTESGKDCEHPDTNKALNHCRADGDNGATKTFALVKDSDKGGVSDGSEDFNLNGVVDSGETNPTVGNGADDGTVVDTDGDGLSDGLEQFLGSDPNNADSDNDGLLDGDEPNPSDDHDGDGKINLLDSDSDGDGLFDGLEAGKDCSHPDTDTSVNQCTPDGDQGATTTSVLNADTDGGGVSDGIEDANKNGVVDPGETDPNDPSDDLCQTDADCGLPNDGSVCDDTTKRCVDGCRGVGDDAGCPEGEECTSTDATIGQCVPSGTGGAGGAGGTGGSAGAGGTSASGGTGGTGGGAAAGGSGAFAPEGAALEGGGCGCSVPGRSSRGGALLALLGAAVLLRRRRR
ncbi:MAG: DUF11 domain-containing protein [Polyangiaceae bacterium]|nr:DUF11 domain-containing protein [Polyangiaceae bacterium]